MLRSTNRMPHCGALSIPCSAYKKEFDDEPDISSALYINFFKIFTIGFDERRIPSNRLNIASIVSANSAYANTDSFINLNAKCYDLNEINRIAFVEQK